MRKAKRCRYAASNAAAARRRRRRARRAPNRCLRSARARAGAWRCASAATPCRSSSAAASAASASSARRHRRAGVGERHLDRRLAHRRLVGQAHAVGREHAGERMDEDARHAERVGDAAGMLAAGAAEALQRVAGDVVAARDRDLLDRVGHVADGDVDEALGHLLGRARRAGRLLDLRRQRGELRADDGAVERFVAARPEHLREERRLDLADHRRWHR